MRGPVLNGSIVVALLAPAPMAADPLDALVAEGLRANRTLAVRRLDLNRAEAAVREAAGAFLPSLTLSARRSERGGEALDLGTLVNPAFAALNQLTGSQQFPTDLAIGIPQRQEVKLTASVALVEPRLWAHHSLRAHLRDAERAAVATDTRALTADLRRAYLDHLKALRVVELYDSTTTLVREVVRVQEALLSQGSVTPDVVARARVDRGEVEQQALAARELADATRQRMNLMLARPVDAPLPRLEGAARALDRDLPLEQALDHARAGRTELAQAGSGLRAAQAAQRLATAAYLPSLAAAVDWGVQGEDIVFSTDEDYTLASLVVSWNLFDGGQREARRGSARAQVAQARQREADARAMVELDVRTRWRAVTTSRTALAVARERSAAAARTYELVERRHRAGAAPFLDLLDARTQLTQSGLNAIVTEYDHLQRCADLVRAAALEPVAPAIPGGIR